MSLLLIAGNLWNGIRVAANDLNFIPNSVKIGQLVHKSEYGDRDTHRSKAIS
jgi:hypothetical protein